MTANADRFTGRVEDYERYRIRYPLDALRILRERCGLRASDVVADIGAGTGMLAELFLENGNPVVAVEPNAEMRAVCERLQSRYSRLTVVDATAETTSLDDASVNFVAAGRAFHWFDPALAIAEFRRIIKPGGWLVLMANGRVHDDAEQTVEYQRILMEEGVDQWDVPSRYRMHDVAAAAFAPGTLVQEQLHGEQLLTLDQFLGQTQSYSSVPLPGHPMYQGMQQALHAYFAKWEQGGVVRMGTTCFMTCGILQTSALDDVEG